MIRSHSLFRFGDYPTPVLGDTPALSYDPPTPNLAVLSPPSRLEITANQVLHSGSYSTLYVLTILLNVVMLTWTVSVAWQKESPNIVIFMEFFINSVLALEVIFRVIVLKKAFLRSLSNILDVSVVVMCYISLIVLWFELDSTQKDTLPAMVLRLFRDFVRFLRLIFLIRKQKQRIVRGRSSVDFKLLPSNNPEASLNSPHWDAKKLTEDDEYIV